MWANSREKQRDVVYEKAVNLLIFLSFYGENDSSA
jgi:hypothetical protein